MNLSLLRLRNLRPSCPFSSCYMPVFLVSSESCLAFCSFSQFWPTLLPLLISVCKSNYYLSFIRLPSHSHDIMTIGHQHMSVPNTQKTRVAVLGPLGTYTHEAAHKVFGDTVEYEERRTISDTFQAVRDVVSIAVVPQENTIFGNVIETYDALRQNGCGFVKGEITLQVQHCLLVQKGVQLHEIEKIFRLNPGSRPVSGLPRHTFA